MCVQNATLVIGVDHFHNLVLLLLILVFFSLTQGSIIVFASFNMQCRKALQHNRKVIFLLVCLHVQ